MKDQWLSFYQITDIHGFNGEKLFKRKTEFKTPVREIDRSKKLNQWEAGDWMKLVRAYVSSPDNRQFQTIIQES